jgi:hypothetical protein
MDVIKTLVFGFIYILISKSVGFFHVNIVLVSRLNSLKKESD